MKYLKRYNQLREANKDPLITMDTISLADIKSICQKYNIKNWTINEDGSVDVDGVVNLSGKGLTQLPLKFGKVSGGFYCSDNLLTSLEGAPIEVDGDFYCYKRI
jgi:hypothetical protein